MAGSSKPNRMYADLALETCDEGSNGEIRSIAVREMQGIYYEYAVLIRPDTLMGAPSNRINQ